VDRSYQLSASSNVLRYITKYPARGLIYDRNGNLLVSNKVVYDLMMVKKQVEPFDTSAFASLLSITTDQVRDAFVQASRQKGYSSRKSVVLLKQLPAEACARLQEKLYLFPGFELQPRTVRLYNKEIASHVLGYIGEVDEEIISKNPYYQQGDYIGISGLEKSYEEYLRGKKALAFTWLTFTTVSRALMRMESTIPLPWRVRIWFARCMPIFRSMVKS
jgi:penicillin-binding protein 2